jgi:photosystem II stability/assembly factor-like uncharacterized protein
VRWRFILLLAAGCAIGSERAHAATDTFTWEWKPFGLQGLLVRSLAASPSLLCAGTQGRGILCLEPAAPSGGWLPAGLDGATVTWIWIDPLREQVRFAACDGSGGFHRLYRTLDGGAHWTPLDDALPPPGFTPWVYAVQGVPGAQTVFAAGGGIWRSDDLGTTWTRLGADPGDDCLEIAPTDPGTIWSGGETVLFSGFTLQSRDGGATWKKVWDSRLIGDNQTADVSAHPTLHGLALTGHEGFVLRTLDNGDGFAEVLAAPARFFLDWDAANPSRAYAAGSPNGGGAYAFVSRDHGATWQEITGTLLAPRTVFRVEADDTRLGVVYAATDDGVWRHYGGGLPLCLDARGGLEALVLQPGVCPPIASPGPAIVGDAIAFDPAAVRREADHVDLGDVECLIAGGDVSLATIDTPEPAPGRALAILARPNGVIEYGRTSDGLTRLPASGDCGTAGP